MSRFRVGDWQLFDEAGCRKYVNAGERARFLDTGDEQTPELRALCYLLAFTGCRISEALALTRDRIDADAGVVFFRTLKRRRTVYRAVPLPGPVIAMLLSCPASEDGRLWRMHRSTAWRQIKRAMGEAGISGLMSCPRGLRHGFGVRAAGRSIPPNLIQRWMGHASGSTTAIYLDFVGDEERGIAERMW